MIGMNMNECRVDPYKQASYCLFRKNVLLLVGDGGGVGGLMLDEER